MYSFSQAFGHSLTGFYIIRFLQISLSVEEGNFSPSFPINIPFKHFLLTYLLSSCSGQDIEDRNDDARHICPVPGIKENIFNFSSITVM
jgi:hypothetical protein